VAQHFILALIVPPLWLLGMPRAAVEAALRYRAVRGTERCLAWPAGAWLAGVGTMLLWHFPPLFNAALHYDTLHIFQHLSFLATGVMFWWRICGPLPERRLPALAAIVHLFSACAACSLLGAALTFSAPGAYPAYLHPEDRLGILTLIRGWGLDPKSDQQLGGMLMWVPGCLVYLSAILVRVGEWYRTPEQAVIGPA
jgi:cytochrome c oxidase assembly factor CtaG